MRSDFINRRFVYRGISAGPPPATRIVEYVFFPTGDISYWQRSTPQVGSAPGISYLFDKYNGMTFWGGIANVFITNGSPGLGIGLLNPWNDAWNESSQSYHSVFDDSESIPARTPTRSIISYDLSAITADSEILNADLRLTVRGKRYWEGTARSDQPSSIDNHPISIKVMPGSFGPASTYGPLEGNTMWHEYFTPQNMSSGWTGPPGILKPIPRILGSSPQVPLTHWQFVSQVYSSNPNIYFDSLFPNETRVVSGNYPGGAYLSTDSSITPESPNLTQGLHFKLPNTATGEANILNITDLVKWQYMKHVKPLPAPSSDRFNIVMHGKIDNPNPSGGQNQGYRLTGLVGGTYGEFKMIIPPYGDTANEFDPKFYKHDAVIVFNSTSAAQDSPGDSFGSQKISFRKSFRHEYLGFTMTNQDQYHSNFLQGMSLSNQPGGLNYFYFITDPNFGSSEIPTHLKDLVRTGFTVGNIFEFNFGYLPPPNQTITESTTAQRYAARSGPEYITCRAQTRRLVDRYDITRPFLGVDRTFTTLVFQNESSSTTNDQGMFSNTSVSPPYYHHGLILTQTSVIPELLVTPSYAYIIADQAKFNIRQLNPVDQGNKNLVEVESFIGNGFPRFFPTPGLGYTGTNLSVGSFVRFTSGSAVSNFKNAGAYEVIGTYDGISGDDYFNTIILQSLSLCQYIEVQRDIIPQASQELTHTTNCANVTHMPILKVRCRESV